MELETKILKLEQAIKFRIKTLDLLMVQALSRDDHFVAVCFLEELSLAFIILDSKCLSLKNQYVKSDKSHSIIKKINLDLEDLVSDYLMVVKKHNRLVFGMEIN